MSTSTIDIAAALGRHVLAQHPARRSPSASRFTLRLEGNTYHPTRASSFLTGRALVADEFLMPLECAQVLHFALSHERGFRMSQVIAPNAATGAVDLRHRRSRLLTNLGGLETFMRSRLSRIQSHACETLGIPSFAPAKYEIQVTASNDDEFFRLHCDNRHAALRTRALSFVYFFHREPCPFVGGDLALFDTISESEASRALHSPHLIEPRQNRLVVFNSGLMHEVRSLRVPSRKFEDSRFTLNGWIHRS